MVSGIFTSCWHKIGRADEHINALKCELVKWANSEPYIPEKKSEIDGSRHSVFVHVTNKPPVERWALCAGDAIHNLRSALDHVLYATVCHKRMQPLTIKEERSIQFPIVSDPLNYPDARDRCLKLITSTTLLDAIESVQPYKRTHAEIPPLLGLLRDFDDADKHRLLNVVLSNVQQGKVSFIAPPDPNRRYIINHYGGSIEDGTEIAWITPVPPQPNLEYYHETVIVVSLAHPPGPNGRKFTELPAIMDWFRDEVIFIVNKVGQIVL